MSSNSSRTNSISGIIKLIGFLKVSSTMINAAIEITNTKIIATIDLNKTGKNISVHYYYAIISSGQISLNVHSEFKWVPHSQLKTFSYIDGDGHILNYL